LQLLSSEIDFLRIAYERRMLGNNTQSLQ
jgi:hypothetical protein